MAKPLTTHITFSDTLAASLGAALKELGRDDQVVSLPDDLGFGPINPPDLAVRRDWIRKEMAPDFRDRELPAGRIAAFWKKALAMRGRRIAWVSTRAAHEVAGFLEFVWRLGEADCELVAFDEDEVIRRGRDGNTSSGRAIVLGELPPYHLAATRYWERAVPLDATTRERHRARWARLREENAPLRILDESGMVSAPISYFDDLLVACTVEQWRKAARNRWRSLVLFLGQPVSPGRRFLSGGAVARAG